MNFPNRELLDAAFDAAELDDDTLLAAAGRAQYELERCRRFHDLCRRGLPEAAHSVRLEAVVLMGRLEQIIHEAASRGLIVREET